MRPTHALIFSLDISKTATGVAVMKMPMLDDDEPDGQQLGRPEIVFSTTLKPTELAKGSARIWFPTAAALYTELHHIIGTQRRSNPFCWPMVAYEGAAWGQNTSEMMVWLQQRLFEWFDSDPITNMDLFGFSPAGARAFARAYSGTPHDSDPKRLSRAIFDDLISRERVVNLSSLAAAQKFSQDAKDAVSIGVAAAISTAQFLRMRQIEGSGSEWSPHYSASQAYFDNHAAILGKTPAYRLTHPNNLRQMMKDLSKRDEPHLSTRNPYLYPARTFRLLHEKIEKPYSGMTGISGRFVYSSGTNKVGDEFGPTLVHSHTKSV